MNLPSILCGVEAVKDRAYFDKTRMAILETREKVTKQFKTKTEIAKDYSNFVEEFLKRSE